MDEHDGDDPNPWLSELDAYARGLSGFDAYTRDYTRDDLAQLFADGLASYDATRGVWVVQGPAGQFEVSDAEVLDTSPDGYMPNAYETRFDGYTRATLDDLVELGLAVYDQERGEWVVYGESAPFKVRDVDAPAQVFMAGPGAGPPPLEALIDHATVRYDAGQPPAGRLEDIIFRALGAADASGVDSTTTGWRAELLQQLEEAGVQAWYEITYADPADPRRPVRVFDEESARHVARRMSGTGEQADVTLMASDGSSSLIGSYLNQQPLPHPGNPGDRPVPYNEPKANAAGEVPWPEPPPWPAGPIPAAAEAAGTPLPVAPGDPRATQLQFPQGISPLPVTATSGGPLRPARLLYADGTPVDFRPMGDSESVPAVAAGAVPAAGDLAPGWLQVIQRESGDLVAVHPALISPREVNPLAWLPYRELRRFGEFDSAEAAGRDSALLQAMFVEQGDRLRTVAGVTREVTEVSALPQAGSVRVTLATTGGGWDANRQEVDGHHTVEVLIPAHHPAEDSPAAGHLFAVPRPELPSYYDAGDSLDIRPGAEYNDLKAALDWIRRGGSAPSPPDAPPASPAEASKRGGGPAGPPAGDATQQQAGWQVSADMTARMHREHSAAAARIGGLAQNPDWLRLRSLTTSARRLAADASAGRLRFSDPAWALRSWRAVWARVCEKTCDLAAGLMTDWLRGPAGHRTGSRAWQSARALHHAAAEGAAHARGWLPRHVRLPAGSYEPPDRPVSAATARAKASAAARRHKEAAGPLSQLDFPADPAEVAGRAPPGRQDRQRATRTTAASGKHARTRPGPPRPG